LRIRNSPPNLGVRFLSCYTATEEQARALVKCNNWSKDSDFLAKCEGKGLRARVEEFDLKGSVLDRAFLSNQLIEPDVLAPCTSAAPLLSVYAP